MKSKLRIEEKVSIIKFTVNNTSYLLKHKYCFII